MRSEIDDFTAEPEGDFIEGIFNYCDRWCERCQKTARCRVYADLAADFDAEHDITQAAFWQKLAGIFTRTKLMIRQAAEERGIDLIAIDEEEIERETERKRAAVEKHDLLKLAEKYAKETQKCLEQIERFAADTGTDDLTAAEMLGVVSWYQFFIPAKIHRGLDARLDLEEETDEAMREAMRNDADGSIKIALIAIDRSIAAWSVLLSGENRSEIELLIGLLEILRRRCGEVFPNAHGFLRPGFDEIEIVM